MKIYFAGSIRGEQPDPNWFQRLIKEIQKHGSVLTEHSFDYSYEEEIKFDDEWIYTTDIGWLREADALIAEVTAPSLGVGYEIGKAEEWGKPILLLHREREGRKPSAMLNGNKDLPMVRFTEEEEALDQLHRFLKSVKA
ncbi:MAG: nucleoside 2-deoxyribosyltransferase [Candidatus Bathyarchaeota archaeon]|nr:nucleoside 2-deoxyribosyltransferase [Candidatus Bathyarchaeota archaeon]